MKIQNKYRNLFFLWNIQSNDVNIKIWNNYLNLSYYKIYILMMLMCKIWNNIKLFVVLHLLFSTLSRIARSWLSTLIDRRSGDDRSAHGPLWSIKAAIIWRSISIDHDRATLFAGANPRLDFLLREKWEIWRKNFLIGFLLRVLGIFTILKTTWKWNKRSN